MATVKLSHFELVGADDGPLRGDIRTVGDGAGRPAVIVCHGFKGFKDWGFFPVLAQRLANAGMTAVSFNFSGSGIGADGETFSEVDRFGHATYTKDVTDVTIVRGALLAGELQGINAPHTVGVFGHSRGGAAAILFAAGASDVAGLVTWNSISTVDRFSEDEIATWRTDGKLDVVNARTGQVLPLYTDVLDDVEQNGDASLDVRGAAARISVPWLVLQGANDEAVPLSNGEALADAGSGELQVIAGGTHTFGARHPWAGTTPHLTDAMDRTVQWFSRFLVG